MRTLRTALLLVLTVGACEAGGAARSDPMPPAPGAGYTPDSVRTAELARFRQGLDSVSELQQGAASREELVRSFVEALSAADSTTLRGLSLSRAEFAWLYYPTATEARPPYDLDPATMWLTTSLQGDRGYARLLAGFARTPLRYVGHECAGADSRQGENTVYGPCTVRLVTAPGDTSEGRLFGLIIERHGRWKFVTYANKLD